MSQILICLSASLILLSFYDKIPVKSNLAGTIDLVIMKVNYCIHSLARLWYCGIAIEKGIIAKCFIVLSYNILTPPKDTFSRDILFYSTFKSSF